MRSIITAFAIAFSSVALAPVTMAQDLDINSLLSIVRGKAPPTAAETVQPQDIAPRSGQFNVILNITLQTPIPSFAPVTCSASITLDGANVTWAETSFVVGQRTGNTARCVITMPYSWDRANIAGRLHLITVVSTGSTATRTRNAHMVRFLPVPSNNVVTSYTYQVRL